MSQNPADPAAVCRHITLDFSGCAPERLNDPRLLESILFQAAQKVHTQVQTYITHCFPQHGVTSVAIVSASHLSIHTWPERGYAGVDLMVYDSDFDMDSVTAWLAERLAATQATRHELRRGPAACEATTP